jgi:hypothetical protein
LGRIVNRIIPDLGWKEFIEKNTASNWLVDSTSLKFNVFENIPVFKKR